VVKKAASDQAIRSARWPIQKGTFYKMVREGLIEKVFPYPGSRPVFSVKQIDSLYVTSSDEKNGSQNRLWWILFIIFKSILVLAVGTL